MALNAHREVTDRMVVPIARRLVRVGVTANALTLGGVLLTAAGITVVLLGHPLAGAFILGAGGVTDALDGAVARLRRQVSPLGAFYDSVGDRVSDAILLGGALWLVRDDPLLFGVGIAALAGAQVTSYLRAKAEALGWSATVGVLERPERVIILVFGIGLGLVPLALWVLAVGAVITVAQRLRAVVVQAKPT